MAGSSFDSRFSRSRDSSYSADDHDALDVSDVGGNSSTSADDDTDVIIDTQSGGNHDQRLVTRIKLQLNAATAGPNPRVPPPYTGSSVLDISCAALRDNLIGRLAPIETPFGSRPLVCEFSLARESANKMLTIITLSWYPQKVVVSCHVPLEQKWVI